jgi:hypothetical protein
MNEVRKIRAGFVGFGEINTPKVFIVKRCASAAKMLKKQGIELIETAPVSDDPEGGNADRAVRELQAGGELDLLVICVAGWIPSWTVFSVIERFKHKPMILWVDRLAGW